jgi:hypothetical protein
MPKHGFSVAVLMPHLAHEADDDEDMLAREPDDHTPGDRRFAADDGTADWQRRLDLEIKLCEAELACLKALRDGDEDTAHKYHRDATRYEKLLAKMKDDDDAS